MSKKTNLNFKPPFYKKLVVKFLIVILLSSIAAFSTNYIVTTKIPEKVFESEQFLEFWNKTVDEEFSMLQKHVTKEKLTCDELINDIPNRAKSDKIVFFFEKLPALDLNSIKQKDFIEQNDIFILHCIDGNLICASYMPGGKLMHLITAAGMISGTLVGAIILFSFIFHLLYRINKLHKQILYTQKTDSEQNIFLKGTDELAILALNIETMRKTLLNLREEEKQIQENQYQLISNLSHDIRTPLTQLIGYAEVQKYQNSTCKKYVECDIDYILDRAHRIKIMSDDLLNCILVDGKLVPDNRELVDGPAFLSQIIYETFCDLEDKNYTVIYPDFNGAYALNVCIKDFQRIFENIYSNILKYANIKSPIIIKSHIVSNKIEISISNTKTTVEPDTPHHGIGLSSIKEIVNRMNGSMKIIDSEELFSITISLPIILRKIN